MASYEAPPSYGEATRQHASVLGGLTFVDFMPLKKKGSGIFIGRKFDSFSELIQKANDWLKWNPQWEVKTCESVEQVYYLGRDEHSKMCHYIDSSTGENKSSTNSFIRYLRLWLVPRTDPSRPPQQIGHINLIPQCTSELGIFKKPTFEPLDKVIQDFNAKLRYDPLPGRILTVETQEMAYHVTSASKFNPDDSMWWEGRTANQFLFIFRIFFELGVPSNEEIGFVDFVPQVLTQKSAAASSSSLDERLESFSDVMLRAQGWCSQNSSVRFCNAQSVRIKIKKEIPLDTLRPYNLHTRITPVMTVLRLVYAMDTQSKVPEASPPLLLTSKTFEPVCLRRYPPKYEDVSQTKARIEAWLARTGARVLSAETVSHNLSHKTYSPCTEVTYNLDLAPYSDFHVNFVRLYFDGMYSEPPAEVLPPVPERLPDKACIIF